jgi:asparagine synthase (glutamine-hydrolysing)
MLLPGLGAALRRISAPLVKSVTSPKYASLLEYGNSFAGAYLLRRALYMPWELGEFLDRDFAAQGWAELDTMNKLEETIRGLTSPVQKVSALELSWYMRNQLLRDCDWAGMAHSLEIRVPLVDVDLFRTAAPLMLVGRARKLDLARTPRVPLPQDVLTKKKTGFVVPVSRWLRQLNPTMPTARGLRAWALAINPPITGNGTIS